MAYRVWLRLPGWLPLPFYGDHGVCYSGEFEDHEANSRTKLHFTWTRQRYEALARNPMGKEIVRIPHPWVMFRKAKCIEKLPDARGTLIFLPHSLPNSRLELEIDEYLDAVFEQNEFPPPYTFVVHPHDMKKGLQHKLAKYEIPTIAFGNNTRNEFIENFYGTVKKFSHAVSARPGSELFYCHELGLKFRCVSVRVSEEADEEKLRKVFEKRASDAVFQSLWSEQEYLFDAQSAASDQERDSFVASVLSLDLARKDQTERIRRLVLRQLPKETGNYFTAVSSMIADKLKRGMDAKATATNDRTASNADKSETTSFEEN